MESWKDELYHHGILGMKWGVTNGPPYPLDKEKSRKIKLEAYKGGELAKNKRVGDKLAAKRSKYESKYKETKKERYKKKIEKVKTKQDANKLIDKYIKKMSYEDMREEQRYGLKVAAGYAAVRLILSGGMSLPYAAISAPGDYQYGKSLHRASRIAAQEMIKHKSKKRK